MKTKATDIFIDLLKEGADVHRCAAARGLGVLGGTQSVPALVKALLDEDPDVRTDAASALSRLKSPESAEALMENLVGDPEGDVKIAAIRALVAMRHGPVVPILRKLVVSRSEDIAWDEDEFYSDGWDSWLDVQLEAIRGLAELGDEAAVPAIVSAMTDEMGQDLSETGVSALAKLGKPGAEALTQLLETAPERLRRQIAREVSAGANAHVAGLQDALLEDDSVQVRLITLAGLKPSDPRLEIFMADANKDIRAAAVKQAGDTFAEKVKTLIADASAKVRTEVFKVIEANPASFKTEKVVENLKTAITGDPGAAKHAALALMALKGPKVAKGIAHVLTDDSVPLDFRLAAVDVLKKAGHQSVPSFLAAAGVSERQLRLAVLAALVDFAANDPIWPNAAGSGLLAALRGELVEPDEDPESEDGEAALQEAEGAEEEPARISEEEMQEIDESLPLVAVPAEESGAASTLESIAAVNPEVVADEPAEPIVLGEAEKRLLELSRKRRLSKKKVSLETNIAPYLDVKRFAARLLAGVVNKDVTESLVAALPDADAEMRVSILYSLGQHGEQTGELPADIKQPLLELLDTTSGETRLLALRTYIWLAGKDVEEKLHDLLADEDDMIRVEAVNALARRGVADEALFDSLNDRYVGVGIAAAKAIAQIWRDEGADALVDYALKNDGAQRRDIGRLLGEFAPETGAKRLIDVLEDEGQRQFWLVAIDALGELFSQQNKSDELKVA